MIETLADRELKDYERDIVITFQGKKYPAFVLMERLLRIVDKDGNNIPFVLNRQQINLYKRICKQRRENRPVRSNVLKARQIGYSTFIAGLFFVIGMFTPNVKIGIVADVKEHAENVFEKYQYFYDHLDDSNPNFTIIKEWEQANKGGHHPLSYKPVLKAQRGQQLLQTKFGNSTIEVVVAGESSGRSTSYHYLHLTECAFFPNLKVTLNGLLETVSSKNKKSMIFLETTANGFNEYKDRWDKDITGKTSYDAVFTPWYDNPDYVDDEYQAYYEEHGVEKELPLLEEWLYEKKEIYHLTNAQMMWYWNKYQDKGDKGMTLQEYPFSPIDAFLTSGNCVFGAELVAKRKEEVVKLMNDVNTRPKQGLYSYETTFSKDGSFIDIENIKFNEFRNGEIKIYAEPDPTHPYVGICDPNNEGSDDVAIQIVDNYTCKEVAVLKSNQLGLDKVAYQFYCLGKAYNWALLSNEMNLGKVVMEYLIKLKYPKLYVNQNLQMDDYRKGLTKKYGHSTTKANRQWMIDSFVIAFKENPSIICDYDTLTQMETFQTVEHHSKSGKVTRKDEATGGNHDDMVTSFMAFYLVRSQQTALLLEKGKSTRPKFESIEEAQIYYEEKLKKSAKSSSRLERFTGINF